MRSIYTSTLLAASLPYAWFAVATPKVSDTLLLPLRIPSQRCSNFNSTNLKIPSSLDPPKTNCPWTDILECAAEEINCGQVCLGTKQRAYVDERSFRFCTSNSLLALTCLSLISNHPFLSLTSLLYPSVPPTSPTSPLNAPPASLPPPSPTAPHAGAPTRPSAKPQDVTTTLRPSYPANNYVPRQRRSLRQDAWSTVFVLLRNMEPLLQILLLHRPKHRQRLLQAD